MRNFPLFQTRFQVAGITGCACAQLLQPCCNLPNAIACSPTVDLYLYLQTFSMQ